MNRRPINPAGRLDVLAFRLLDKFGTANTERREWPLVRGIAWNVLNRTLGPGPIRSRRRRLVRRIT